jgi:hypothetical protein
MGNEQTKSRQTKEDKNEKKKIRQEVVENRQKQIIQAATIIANSEDVNPQQNIKMMNIIVNANNNIQRESKLLIKNDYVAIMCCLKPEKREEILNTVKDLTNEDLIFMIRSHIYNPQNYVQTIETQQPPKLIEPTSGKSGNKTTETKMVSFSSKQPKTLEVTTRIKTQAYKDLLN